MAATPRRSNGKEVRQKPRGRKRLNGWHSTRREALQWLMAVEHLDTELAESIEHGGTARPRTEVPW